MGKRRETYIIDTVRNTITNGPDLKMKRFAHGCEKINVNGESFILVSGGYCASTSTEVLSVANYRNGGWQYGPNLPVNMADHEMVSSSNNQDLYTFGNGYSGNKKDIFKFSCSGNINSCQWTKSNLKLKYGR